MGGGNSTNRGVGSSSSAGRRRSTGSTTSSGTDANASGRIAGGPLAGSGSTPLASATASGQPRGSNSSAGGRLILSPASRSGNAQSIAFGINSVIRGSHWCHQCDASVDLTPEGCCQQCGGGFVEEGRLAMRENPTLRLVSALQAVTELGAQLETQEGTASRGVPRLLGQRVGPRGDRQEIRIDELLRGLQSHLRMAEAMRAHLTVSSEAEVVANTSYTAQTGTTSNNISPLDPSKWDSIETVTVESDAECKEMLVSFQSGAYEKDIARGAGYSEGGSRSSTADPGSSTNSGNANDSAGAAVNSKVSDDVDAALTLTEMEGGCAICCCPLWEEGDGSVQISRLPRCKHEFHKTCLEQWFKRASSCPICRFDLNAGKILGDDTTG